MQLIFFIKSLFQNIITSIQRASKNKCEKEN